jgi:hypothetical protein
MRALGLGMNTSRINLSTNHLFKARNDIFIKASLFKIIDFSAKKTVSRNQQLKRKTIGIIQGQLPNSRKRHC